MANLPYVKFYVGDWLKDTRILPLNARGAWVDLIMFIWNKPDRDGTITGTHEDFARMLGCSMEEWRLVNQMLNQNKIFGYRELPDGRIEIASRKIQKILKLSEMRYESGKKGGNPKLLVNQTDNQTVIQNPEHEHESNNTVENRYKVVLSLSNKISTKLRPLNIKDINELKADFLSLNKDKSEEDAYAAIDKDCAAYVKFMEYITNNAPRVHDMKEPFTIRQFLQVVLKVPDAKKVSDLLLQMHNWKPLLSKNISAYKTFINWLDKPNRA